ncbi:MAG TPA: polyamine aminopropyltransferase [Firmicutes bacterium]|jgi:spermidine synthase|nr:polyamine aminopropyltransferase [Bacillota bacterium]
MELWFTEKQTPSLALSCLVKSTVYREKTKYQDLAILDTVEYGRMLALDGIIMTTEKDEFFYHEMITHVAMHTHARPEQVLVVGGGDGGTVREVLKHPTVSRVVLAEIDEGVVNAARKYLPTLAQGLSDPRVEIQITDAIVYVREHPGEFDVVIVDSTDPIGPGVGLFTREFYQDVAKALKDGGIMVAQTESPVNNKDLIQKIHRNLQGVFPLIRLYLGPVPTYPSGLWSYTLCSKGPDPVAVPDGKFLALETKYYTPEVHRSAFALPLFVKEWLG